MCVCDVIKTKGGTGSRAGKEFGNGRRGENKRGTDESDLKDNFFNGEKNITGSDFKAWQDFVDSSEAFPCHPGIFVIERRDDSA